MTLPHTFINRIGELEVVPYHVWCDNVTMTCPILPDCAGIIGMNRIWPSKQRAVRDLYNHCKDDKTYPNFGYLVVLHRSGAMLIVI